MGRRIVWLGVGIGLSACGNSKPEHVRPLDDSADEEIVWARFFKGLFCGSWLGV